jgi:hypothetical protein
MTNTNQVEARALRAQGVPVTLLDGREVRLVFDLDAIAQIEDDFGSLGGMQDALERIEKQGASAQFFRPVLKMMRAALLHDESAADAMFDTALIGDYYRAVMKATQLAFPKGPRANAAQAPTPIEPITTDFPGTPSTTQAPSNTVEPTGNFGE